MSTQPADEEDVVVLAGPSPAQHRAPAGIRTPSSSTPVAPRPADPPTRARQVLTRALVGLRDVRTSWFANASYEIDAAYWQRGAHTANVDLSVRHEPQPSSGNPCVLATGQVAGHQGAPAPDDVCTAQPQSDGTVVWTWRMGHSAYRPWTTTHTQDWQISQVRGDGTVIVLEVSNTIGMQNSGLPMYASTPFDIPASTLVQIVTASRLRLDGPCTHHCATQLPGPFGPPTPPHS